MSPKGQVLTQKRAEEITRDYDRLIILCGHYEGIDQRVIDEIVDEEISIGDYVLTGGELPACILVDCVSRMIEGVLAAPECYESESIASGLLEYPQYTRPYEFHGVRVPEVLISGHHANIEKWRYEEAWRITAERRPDLLMGHEAPGSGSKTKKHKNTKKTENTEDTEDTKNTKRTKRIERTENTEKNKNTENAVNIGNTEKTGREKEGQA